MKKRHKLSLPMLALLSTLALANCADATSPTGPGNPSTPTTTSGRDQYGNKHNLSTKCNGGDCFVNLILNRCEAAPSTATQEITYDTALWDSWYKNGGDYHNGSPTRIVGRTSAVYDAKINGTTEKTYPCFSTRDISAAEAAARALPTEIEQY